mgnify:CR=1 FL=1
MATILGFHSGLPRSLSCQGGGSDSTSRTSSGSIRLSKFRFTELVTRGAIRLLAHPIRARVLKYNHYLFSGYSRDSPRVFVLDRNRVSGIVTRGDLQKAPVRMLLFGLLTLLEMQLLRLIRIYYLQDSWQKLLKEDRLNSAKERLAERQARNEAIGLADCLQFCDKRVIILKTPEVRESIGLKSKNSGERLLKCAEDLRNKLAHAQDLVTGSSWPAVIDLAKDIEAILKKCEEIEIDRQAASV